MIGEREGMQRGRGSLRAFNTNHVHSHFYRSFGCDVLLLLYFETAIIKPSYRSQWIFFLEYVANQSLTLITQLCRFS
jgi:hypothetical protein